MEPLNENETSSPLQRLLIGAGTLIVVILTVIAAIFLAMQDLPEEEPTPIVQVTPATIATNTPTLTPPTLTHTPTPSLTHTPSATPVPPLETTEAAPTPTHTNTPEPQPPTLTPTPVVVVITATPLPTTPIPSPAANGACPIPQNWIVYTVQTGDTLNSLASRTNVSVFDLQQANCLTSFTIRPGQEIFLPFTPPPPTNTPTPIPAGTRQPTPTRTPTAIVPVINNVVPDRVDEDIEAVTITVLGRNFRARESGFQAELRGPQSVVLQLTDARTDTSFDAIVPSGLPVGIYDIVVTNPNNRAGVRESAFIIGEAPPTPTIAPGPRIDDVDPEEGFNDEDVIIEVRGRDFRADESAFQVQLRIGSEIKAELELVGTATSTAFNAIIPAGLPPDVYDLWVINPDGKEDVEPDAYESREG